MTDVVIRMSKEEAERISFGLSDLLCWHAGYASGVSSDPLRSSDDDPMGRSEAREINIKIKQALNRAEEEA